MVHKQGNVWWWCLVYFLISFITIRNDITSSRLPFMSSASMRCSKTISFCSSHFSSFGLILSCSFALEYQSRSCLITRVKKSFIAKAPEMVDKQGNVWWWCLVYFLISFMTIRNDITNSRLPFMSGASTRCSKTISSRSSHFLFPSVLPGTIHLLSNINLAHAWLQG